MWLTGLVAPRHVGSSQTRARTHVPCIGRQILNHCATREARGLLFDSYNRVFGFTDVLKLLYIDYLSILVYNYLLYAYLTSKFTENKMIWSIQLGDTLLYSLGAEDSIAALQRIHFYNCESHGGHLLSWMAALLKSFCLLLKFQVLG